MKRFIIWFFFLLWIISYNINAQVYQLSNPGFEQWDGGSNDEPTHWNGFPSADCTLIIGCGTATSSRHEKSTDTRPGSSGIYCCKIFATSALGIIANGNITTGQIRIGSSTPTSSQNYNITRTGNSNFRQPLNAKPDSIRFWAKFVCPSSSQEARISAVIHDNYDYRDPETSDANAPSHVVAKAIHNFPRGSQNWVQYKIPFSYSFPASTPAYILVTFTTNKMAGEGSTSDALYIDDIELIYNPRLSDLQVNGVTIPGFHPETTNYYLSVPCYSSQTVTATTASQNATVQYTQASYASPVANVLVSAGNINKQYNIHFTWESVTPVFADICAGSDYSDSYFSLPVHSSPGTFYYDNTTYSTPGCDSVVHLTLNVHPNFFPDTIEAMICEGGNYNFYGQILSDAGIYDTIIPTTFGCDSLVVLDLEVGPYYLFTIFASICDGDNYNQNGFNTSQPGLDTLFLVAHDGCDSLMVLNLTVNDNYETDVYDTIMQNQAYAGHGFVIPAIETPGTWTYTQNLLSSHGCDSTVYLYLTVLEYEEEPIDEDPEFTLIIFPNPAEDYFTIEVVTYSTAQFWFDLYDPYGRIRKAGEIHNKKAIVYFPELSGGIYLLKVRSSERITKAVKILKY